MIIKNLLLFLFSLFFVTNMAGQETVLGVAPNGYAVSFSPNGEKVIFTRDSYTDDQGVSDLGLVKIFAKNTNYTYDFFVDAVLPKRVSYDVAVVTQNMASITNGGNWSVYYQKGIDNNDVFHFSLVKNGVEISLIYDEQPNCLNTDNDNFYLSVQTNSNCKLYKIDNQDDFVWDLNIPNDYASKILANSSELYANLNSGDLLKIDPADGSIIQTITAEPDDVFQINENDYLEWLDYSDMKLYTETGSTEWEYRFWTETAKGTWKKLGNYTYFARGTLLYVFDNEMEDVYKQSIATLSGSETILSQYIYDDGTVTYVTRDSNTQEVNAKHFTLPIPEVPLLNTSATNVVEVHNEEIFDGTNWVPSNSFISTVVMNDADIPVQGTEVDQNLVIAPTGYTLLDYSPFIPTVNADGYAEYIYYKSSGGDLYIRLKVYFQPLSDVSSIDEIETNKIDLGYYDKDTQTFNFNQSIDISKYQVYDMNGRKIISNDKQVDKVELKNLKTGIYIIKAYDKNENEYKKKIIKY